MKKYRIRKGSLLGRIVDHTLRRNKLYSTILMLIGYVSMKVLEDCTVFVLMLCIGIPVFFAKENVID